MDERLSPYPSNDPNYNTFSEISKLPKHIFDEMKHFFKVYKELEGKKTAVHEVQSKEEGAEDHRKSIQNYKAHFKDY